MKTFGERLEKAMKDKGLNGVQIGKLLGKAGRGSASTWITGKAKPNADDLVKLAEILEISVEWLLTGAKPYVIEEGTINIAAEQYVEYMTLKTEKLQKENEALKNIKPLPSKT